MRRRHALLVHIIWVSMAVAAVLYLATPVPYRAQPPAIQALAASSRFSFGTAGFITAGTTTYYSTRANDRLRAALREELVAKGYAEEKSGQAVTYRRPLPPGLYRADVWLLISATGNISSGTTRHKWPFA